MKINIIIFGQLRDIIGEQLELDSIVTTDALQTTLHKKYPAMVSASYMLAVNKKLVTENTSLTENCTVAILSPFSGG
jgi:sulfur-carrier protein